MSDPGAAASPVSLVLPALRTSPERRSMRAASPLVSTYATTPASGSKPRIFEIVAVAADRQMTESGAGSSAALTIPPAREARTAIASGPREADDEGADDCWFSSPLQATRTSVSPISLRSTVRSLGLARTSSLLSDPEYPLEPRSPTGELRC